MTIKMFLIMTLSLASVAAIADLNDDVFRRIWLEKGTKVDKQMIQYLDVRISNIEKHAKEVEDRKLADALNPNPVENRIKELEQHNQRLEQRIEMLEFGVAYLKTHAKMY